MSELLVRDRMQGQPPTVSPDTGVADLANLLADERLSSVPVVDEAGAVVGVISRADVVRALAEEW
jgi:CBS domain-containing protein